MPWVTSTRGAPTCVGGAAKPGEKAMPIDRCSRRLVPALRAGGHALEYTEFAGGHTVSRALARRAIEWMLDG